MMLKNRSMKIKLEPTKIHDEYIAFPRCQNAIRACRLAKKNFLVDSDVKLLELMGFEVEMVKRNVK